MPNDDYKEKRMSLSAEEANAEMKLEEYTIANECVEGTSLSFLQFFTLFWMRLRRIFKESSAIMFDMVQPSILMIAGCVVFMTT